MTQRPRAGCVTRANPSGCSDPDARTGELSRHRERLGQELRNMTCANVTELPQLFAAAEAIRDDHGTWIGADRGQQHALGERDRELVLLMLEAEGTGHPAAAT